MTEQQATAGGPWLTVRLPASTRIKLTLRLGLRTRPPSCATPFGGLADRTAAAGSPAAAP